MEVLKHYFKFCILATNISRVSSAVISSGNNGLINLSRGPSVPVNVTNYVTWMSNRLGISQFCEWEDLFSMMTPTATSGSGTATRSSPSLLSISKVACSSSGGSGTRATLLLLQSQALGHAWSRSPCSMGQMRCMLGFLLPGSTLCVHEWPY